MDFFISPDSLDPKDFKNGFKKAKQGQNEGYKAGQRFSSFLLVIKGSQIFVVFQEVLQSMQMMH